MYSALQGVTVLEFSQMIAGPYCSMLLGDLGADVIKIEHPRRADLLRGATNRVGDDAYAFLMVNRNKRSLGIDFANPRSVEILYRLVERADVVISGFRPGAMERYGLGSEELRRRNPRLVYCSVSGFGTTGPYRTRGAFDLIAQAMSGLMSVTGREGAPPARCGYPVLDIATASFAALAVMGALFERQSTGMGQHVEASLLETGIACSIWQTTRYLLTGEVSPAYGPGLPGIVSPYQLFRAQDGHLVVGIGGPEQWRRACAILGLPDELRDDPSLATPQGRHEQRERVVPPMEARFATGPVDHWVRELAAAGLPVGPVNTIDRTLEDPHVKQRGVFVELDHPVGGKLATLAAPFRSNDHPARLHRNPPGLGEHTREVLRSVGISDDEVAELERAGALHSPAPAEG